MCVCIWEQRGKVRQMKTASPPCRVQDLSLTTLRIMYTVLAMGWCQVYHPVAHVQVAKPLGWAGPEGVSDQWYIYIYFAVVHKAHLDNSGRIVVQRACLQPLWLKPLLLWAMRSQSKTQSLLDTLESLWIAVGGGLRRPVRTLQKIKIKYTTVCIYLHFWDARALLLDVLPRWRKEGKARLSLGFGLEWRKLRRL